MSLRLVTTITALVCAIAFPTAAAGTATHDGSRTFRVHEGGHDFNICGFPGTFDMVTTTEWHAIEVNGGFHFQLTEVATWTVVFDDPELGIWRGRGTETDQFTGTPGDVVQFHVIFNGREGPVRIHEHQQVVVGADGNLQVDLEQVATDYAACPS